MTPPSDLRQKRFPVVERAERITEDAKRLGWLMVTYRRHDPEAPIFVRLGLEPPLVDPALEAAA